jgi:rSAM/selenodomain-associated transferase 1
MIIVFARAPVPGEAKTRLVPRLGAWGAARLHARLTLHAVRVARLADDSVELHGTRRHSFFRTLKVRFRLQRGRDLGERMQRAMAKALRRHAFVTVIGSDCPMLTPADLRRAARWLRCGCDVVLAPAEDGGYALIAARRLKPEFFSEIRWGGADVYAETARRLAAAGYGWRALRKMWDVDRPEDLPRFAELRLRWPRSASAARRGARR